MNMDIMDELKPWMRYKKAATREIDWLGVVMVVVGCLWLLFVTLRLSV